ncbi:MAG: GNAT family N-acetyltransferase [Bacteroidales bacterium]|nr:GNAT family N-acetyltransferase [Bacteroidales bacterium]
MIEVAEAYPNNQSRIVDFQVAMAKETEGIDLDRHVVEKGVKAVFDDPSKGKYYTATIKDKVAASLLTTFEWSDWRNGEVYWIQSVYVLPEFRKQGVYKMMYKYIQDQIAELPNIMGIRLYVDSDNKPAQTVYAKLNMDGNHYRLFEWMKS